jgi:hypothetical protein
MIVCFASGVLIATEQGDVAVENLVPGDKILTLDHGYQPLQWVGNRALGLGDLIANPKLRPIRIGAGSLGRGLPRRDLNVSPQHRMLVDGPRAELLFGEAEVLVAATHLTGLAGVEQALPRGVTYFHLLFDRHEIICAEGSWTESYQPSNDSVNAMDQAQREELLALFPKIDKVITSYGAARHALRHHETKALLWSSAV